jgi:pimeloyl-ACP methyl ester carboxylesterase
MLILKDTPIYQVYQRVAAHPEDFPQLLTKMGKRCRRVFDFSKDVRSLQVPTLIVAADADMAPPSHYVEVFKLLDGGLRDPLQHLQLATIRQSYLAFLA